MTTDEIGIKMGRTKKKQEIWGEVLTEKGYMRVPRALRLRRAEIGMSNNEYAILLDYLDYYTYSGGQNPYRHLAQVNGVSERTIKTTLGKLARKGLVGRIVKNDPSGRTKGVVFSIEPLLLKLRRRVKDLSPTEGEKNFTYEDEEIFTPNTREDGKKKRDIKNSSSGDAAPEEAQAGKGKQSYSDDISEDLLGDSLRETRKRYGVKGTQIDAENKKKGRDLEKRGGTLSPKTTGARADDNSQGRKKERYSKDSYSSTRWYNEVFSEIYSGASGQPVLTGGREYGAARTYFSRLKELNPVLGPEEIFERATHGARFMLESQLRGGVFGWMHCPPDICMLSSQAQAVDYHLRKTVIVNIEAQNNTQTKQVKLPEDKELREKEAQYASEEITRIYGELSGLGRTRG
jgi:hypothetical protein